MRKILILSIGAILFTPAMAEEKTFSWTPPDSYTDGTPMPLSAIAAYRLVCNGNTVSASIPGADTSYRNDFDPGVYSCVMHTVADTGVESSPSNAVNFTVAPRTPSPVVLSVD